MKVALAAAALILTLPHGVQAQAIQRCEGPNQRVTYANSECPPGTKPTRAVTPAPQPSAAARAAAEAKLQSYREQSKAPVQPPRAPAAPAAPAAQDAALQKAADCGYLQAAIESERRLRNVLTTRPYYSTEDVDDADARARALLDEYRRVCG